MPKKIAVLGDIYVDVHTGPLADLPVWNSDLFSQNIKFLVGGSAGNTSRCLGGFSRFDNIQALGVDSRLFSALGDDDVSQLVISKLSRERLTKTDGSVVTINGCTAPTSIVLYGDQKRTFISNNGSLIKYTANLINKELLSEYDHLHFAGDEMVALLREIRSQGLTVSMDCQFDPTLEWTGENGNLAHFLPLVDVFLPNEHEAMSITRTESVAEAAEALSRMMPQGAVLVKNGGKGVLVKLPREESVCVPAFKAETVVDTTGAGDSFNAGFLSSWVREKRGEKREIIKNWLNSGKRLMTAAAFGCAAANLCVQSVGAFVQGIDFSKVKNVVEEGKFAE